MYRPQLRQSILFELLERLLVEYFLNFDKLGDFIFAEFQQFFKSVNYPPRSSLFSRFAPPNAALVHGHSRLYGSQ